MTFSPDMPAASAVRTWSTDVGCANFTTTMVPPEKSIPSGRPLVMAKPMPATMTSVDRAMACQRHLMKS